LYFAVDNKSETYFLNISREFSLIKLTEKATEVTG